MILTIGMIVKNEERYLRQCLEALSPILTQVDSELIIADTGSTDRTVEIAKEFTDQVFFFEWCNDFSAARNAVLRRGKGRWFMSLDADEVFENAQVIADFFLSGEFKNYNTAAYIQRNSSKKDRSTYSDLRVIRMTKRFPKTRYVNPIHEILDPMKPPTKYLPAIAVHYGYVTEGNGEAIAQKSELYLKILEGEARRDPKSPKHLYDIERVHFMQGNLDLALEYCRKGLSLAKAGRNHMVYPLFVDNAAILHTKGDHTGALAAIEDYFQYREKPVVFDLEMHCIAGHSHFNLQQYAAGVASFEAYLKVLEEFRSGLYHGPELVLYSESNSNESSQRKATIQLLRAYLLTADFPGAKAALETRVPDAWYRLPDSAAALIELEIIVMQVGKDYSGFPRLFSLLDDAGRGALVDRLEEELTRPEVRQVMLESLSAIPADSEYLDLMKLRYLHYYSGSMPAAALDAFFSRPGMVGVLYADALYFAVCAGYDAAKITGKFDLLNLNAYFTDSRYFHFSDLPTQVQGRYLTVPEHAAPEALLLQAQLWHLVLPVRTPGSGEMLVACDAFARASAAFARAIGAADTPEGEPNEGLPPSLRAGRHFYTAMYDADPRRRMSALRGSAHLCPDLIGAVRTLADVMRQSLPERSDGADA